MLSGSESEFWPFMDVQDSFTDVMPAARAIGFRTVNQSSRVLRSVIGPSGRSNRPIRLDLLRESPPPIIDRKTEIALSCTSHYGHGYQNRRGSQAL